MKISKKAHDAILIAALCAIAYLAVYFARNVLSAVSQQMLDSGFNKEYIGGLSSVFFIF